MHRLRKGWLHGSRVVETKLQMHRLVRLFRGSHMAATLARKASQHAGKRVSAQDVAGPSPGNSARVAFLVFFFLLLFLYYLFFPTLNPNLGKGVLNSKYA
jgi:hypothetical protein